MTGNHGGLLTQKPGYRRNNTGNPARAGSCQRHEGSAASAALRWLLDGWLIQAFACLFVFLFAFFGAHGTALGPASTTTGGFLHFAGAPGARFGASTAAGSMRSRHSDAAGTDQAGNAEPGEQFLQIPAFHTVLPVQDDGFDRMV